MGKSVIPSISWHLRHVIAVSLFLLLSQLEASAANIPPGEQPGAQASRFQSSSEQNKQRLEKKKVKPVEIEMEKEKKAPIPEGIKFVLKELKITGSTIFKPEDLAPAYQAYIGKEVSFKDLDNITEKIKAKYKQKGYLTTTVYVPEQSVSEGKVQIKISEGKMGEVKVEGNKWFSSSLIGRYIHSKKNELLNIFTLQKDILRLNQNSDLEVKAVIAPGKDPESTDLTLKVTDHFPYHAGTVFDNQGTILSGKNRTSVSFRSSNLSGHNDSLYFSTQMAANSYGDFVSYTLPVNTSGLKAAFDCTIFANKLGKDLKVYDITGNTQIYTPHMSGEIYLSEDFQANIDAGIDIKSVKKFQIGNVTANDQLRIPYIDFDLTKMDALFGGGQTTFSPRFDFSTAHFLGASSYRHTTASRPNTGGFYFKYEQSLKRVQKMFFESYASIRTQFQIPTSTLPSSEQFQLGGANSIRGYPEGDYLADIGASLNIDWIFPFYPLPKDIKLPFADMPLRNQLQPVIFMDLGGGKIMETAPGERDTKFLMGLGGGLRFQFNKNIFLRLDWAERVGDRPTQGQGPSNFYITFQGEI